MSDAFELDNEIFDELQQEHAAMTAAMTELSKAEQFFYENAGYSYDPKTETQDEGRKRCAREYAAAEEWAKIDQGARFHWESDRGIDHVKEFPDAYDSEPETCEQCTMIIDGVWVASLGCIDDATDDYRRVIEAQLASEVMPSS